MIQARVAEMVAKTQALAAMQGAALPLVPGVLVLLVETGPSLLALAASPDEVAEQRAMRRRCAAS